MNSTWSEDSCRRLMLTSGHSQPRPESLLKGPVTTIPSDTCVTAFLYISLILCVIGILSNLVNILVFIRSLKVRDDKTPFLIGITVSDLLFLLNNLPYLIIQIRNVHTDTSGRFMFGVYIEIRYALNFIFICISSWMLVAVVTKKLLSKQSEITDDSRIKPLQDADQVTPGKSEKSWMKKSLFYVATIPIIAIILHGAKLFEYQTSVDANNPHLLEKRPALTGIGYELYTMAVNAAVTLLTPYVLLAISSTFYFLQIVTIMMRNKMEREPICDVCLMFSLGILHLVCYGGSLRQYMTLLFTKTAGGDNSCFDACNSTMVIFLASVKFIPYKLFSNSFKGHGLKLPMRRMNHFHLGFRIPTFRSRGGDIIRKDFSFRNPTYEHETEVQN